MNRKLVWSIVCVALATILVVANVATSKQDQASEDAGIPSSMTAGYASYQYVAKFACGLVQPNTRDSYIISPGDYKTIINIHNPQSSNVSIKKKIVIASAEEPRNPIAPIWSQTGYRDLQPDHAFRMDCPDIYTIAKVTPGTFIEGFVVLFPSPSRQIDVTALYTAGSPVATAGGSIVAMEIETIKPKISVPTVTSYVDNPP